MNGGGADSGATGEKVVTVSPMQQDGLLSGIRVIDLTRALSGPFCTMLLGDQGAEVIKIERPGRGDDSRTQSNPRLGSENTAFLSVNRNKKSVVVDLRRPEGARIVQRLAATADVFVENFRPGKADELGLGWQQLSAENPRLVYCSISGWGADGPSAHKPGYATTAEAMGGLMSVTGERNGPPMKIGVSLVDSITGLFAKDAITAALYARERHGRGQKIETSLLESTVATLSMTAYAYLMAGVVAGRVGSEHAFIVPWKTFATSDGYLVVAAGNETQWQALCRAIDRPDLADNPRYRTMPDRAENRAELYALLDEVFAKRTTDEWIAALEGAGTATAKVQSMDQVFADPQVLHRNMLLSVRHPTLGDIPQVGHAQKFSGNPAQIRLAPPLLGEHTFEVLGEVLGCTSEQLQAWAEDKIIFPAEATA